MAKQPINLTGLKKGDILYRVETRTFYENTGVIEATIERVTTTSDYVICHMSYICYITTAGKRTTYNEKDPALFPNKKDINLVDLTGKFWTDRKQAENDYKDWRYDNRARRIGSSLQSVFNELKRTI